MTPDEELIFMSGYAAALAGEPPAEALAAERLQQEAIVLGVRRMFRKELADAFNRGRRYGMKDMVDRLRAEHFEDAEGVTR